MAGIPWPHDDPGAWNTCELAGIALPGLAHVKVKLSEELEVKKPKGGHGATITRQGYALSDVTIVLRMWTAAQWEEWQGTVKSLRPAPKSGDGTGARPVAITHAKANAYGIRAISIKEITDDAAAEGFTGLYEVTLACVEHAPPPKVTATKTDSNSNLEQNFEQPFQKPAKPSTTGNRP